MFLNAFKSMIFYAFLMKTEQMLNQVCDEDIAAANKAKNKKYVFTKCR